ncbi:MAG: excinuclease ABC subunit UvrB [Phycisphaeraceae bacterium]|nr:excinuclease ABC subunit UvrB [Phycisphaeraceae bacterium]
MASASRRFELVSPFTPTGDQPGAIETLSARLAGGARHSVLLGATGTGKTFTMANVIARYQRPTLILSHNKTLAAQLFEEMKELFPRNAVSYFVSYYDYYQPEAYIPQRDIYIEKDASRNDDLDKLRLAATSNILSRRDTIVVASVSCIFGLGSPETYGRKVLTIDRSARVDRRKLLLALDAMQYKRSDVEFKRGQFRVRGDVLEIYPAYEQHAVRVELGGETGDGVASIRLVNPTSGEELAEEQRVFIFPAAHYVTEESRMQEILSGIRAELAERLDVLRSQGKLLEAQRLAGRTRYDLEMLEEVGFCNGIENYSRHMDGRAAGERPWTLLDYFDFSPDDSPDGLLRVARRPEHDWLMIIDESHVTMPQIRAMYRGDQMRKQVLVDHGFRLPSALDNRPLKFEEFEGIVPRVVYVSATPGPYELEKAGGEVAEQVIRPTGLLDPVIEVRPADGQVPDLLKRCAEVAARGQRVLVTALTKRLCEDLTNYIHEKGLRVRYLHSEIETLERLEILADLRRGAFDVLVGVNLLREGLDLPEVALVCILDADKEGFLRSPTSLIQTIGRAARNVDARVVMYADAMTPAMRAAIDETERRRAKQIAYNAEHGITPRSIEKAIRTGLERELRAGRTAREAVRVKEPEFETAEMVRILEEEMLEAAAAMEFEKAAKLRDQASALRSGKVPAAAGGRVRRSDIDGGASRRNEEPAPGMPGTRPDRKRKAKGRSLKGKPGF